MTSSRRILPLLLLLFIGSGCAALIYEIVWFQLLQLLIGSSAVSLGVLLAAFMGGMCAGSLCLPRVISPRWHPLRVYAGLEIGIGVMGIAILMVLPVISQAYVYNAAGGWAGIALRAVVCAVCLVPPTLLMGATLPAISRWVEMSREGVAWLGFFYGGNTCGAVVGSLLAGFYLLRVHDMVYATYVAVGINAAVAALSVVLSLVARRGQAEPSSMSPAGRGGGVQMVHLVIALSGASALAAEVVWTRLLSLLLGATVYTFSIILAVFLIGLGIGSSLGAALARQTARARTALALCQLGLAGAIVWTCYALTQSLPYWPIDPNLVAARPDILFQLDLTRTCFAILPATILWGASFPLALAAAAFTPSPGTPGEGRGEGSEPSPATSEEPHPSPRSPRRPRGPEAGRLVGGVYAANTLGAICGALVFSLVLIPLAGTQQAQRVMIGIAVMSAFLALTGYRRLIALAAVPLFWAVWPAPWELVAYGRFLATTPPGATELFVGEGINSSVAVTEETSGVRNFHVAGKIEASTEPQDMRLQRMLGDLPGLLHPGPRSVLVVGCGAGVTAGSFITQPDVKRIVICEIEPLVPKVVSTYFSRENYDVVNNPRVQIVYDDARHYVLTTKEKFDIITSDPIHPWVKGAATLYTQEYFEICKKRLNPGGVVTQWVPLYQTTEATVQSELATFFAAFPDGTVWGNPVNGSGYDVVLMGQAEPSHIDVDAWLRRLRQDDYKREADSLSEVGFSTAIDLLATYAGRGPDLKEWLTGAEINHDRNLRLAYLAGWGVDTNESDRIYNDMLDHASIPQGLFTATAATRMMLDMAVLHGRAHP